MLFRSQVNTDGLLVTPAGLPVLGDGGPITVPVNAAVEIATDGTINTTEAGQRPQKAGRLKLVEAEGSMTRGTDGLFRAADGSDLTLKPEARLQSGALEGSNVSAVETMIAMIAASRQFEQQLKMLQGAEQRDQGAAKLLSAQ